MCKIYRKEKNFKREGYRCSTKARSGSGPATTARYTCCLPWLTATVLSLVLLVPVKLSLSKSSPKAFLTLVYTPSVTATTAGSIGMNIVVAIVFGGMPISGGPRSRIYSALVGGFSYILLNNILKLLIDSNIGYGVSQIVSAVFFLAVVYITGLNYRSQMLPR